MLYVACFMLHAACCLLHLQVVIGTKVGRAKHVRIMPGGALALETAAMDTNTAAAGAMNMNTASRSRGHSSSTTTGTTKSRNNANYHGTNVNSVFVGQTLDDHRGAFLLEYPMRNGCVLDGHWDSMDMIWNVSMGCVLCMWYCGIVVLWYGIGTIPGTRYGTNTVPGCNCACIAFCAFCY
jgi:hypothetical protein